MLTTPRLPSEIQATAEHLQSALLPQLPQPGHLQLAARYSPARSETGEVGRDWYDSFVLHDLGGRTPYSKSSWERNLNGKALPAQHAVTSLGKLADADPARLVALWELANTAWHDPRTSDTNGPAMPTRSTTGRSRNPLP
ncbi:hypothetical protein [Streptomyces sp. NPDC007206]|uniref:hypothetical protein n=1 Tax=Streptomyces sp. NPDC007206 TaxID=3154317 RepID=UPI0033CFF31F